MATPLDPQKRPDIFIIRGDTASINLEVPEIDLTGCTVFFTAKAAFDDDVTDAAAVIAVETTSHTDPEAGETTINLSPADTTVTPGIYYYDIQVKDGSGNITSIAARKLQIFADVTRRTT